MIRVRWQAPLTRVSGRPISDAEIDGYRLEIRVEGAPDFTILMVNKVLEFSVDADAPGLYEFRVFTVDTAGRSSAPASGSVAIPDTTAPGAPVNLVVDLV